MSIVSNLPVYLPGAKGVQIGYHRKSDNSVSSSFWRPGAERTAYVAELMADPDVMSAWYRTPDPLSDIGLSRAVYFKEPAPLP